MVEVQDQDELRIFLEELNENLSFLDNAIIALEENPTNKEMIQEIFRVAHTVKGNAGFLSIKNLVDLGHAMEEVFKEFEKGNIPVTSPVIDTLLECKDAISAIGARLSEGTDPGAIPVQHLIEKVNSFVGKGSPEAPPSASGSVQMSDEEIPEYVPGAGLIRVWISPNEPAPSVRAFLVHQKINSFSEIIRHAPGDEELESPDFAASERELRFWVHTALTPAEIPDFINIDLIERIEYIEEDDLRKLNERKNPESVVQGGGKQQREDLSISDTVRIPVARLDTLLNLVGELVIANSGLIQIQEYIKDRPELADVDRQVRDRVKEIFRISGDVQELVMKSRLVPIGQVFSRFKRFARDYSSRTGKKIHLELEGEETEIDKKIIDEMIKPLTHLVRNSADHGLEDTEERKANGKNETGLIRLAANQEGNYINVIIEDDGRGLDYNKIVSKAISKGLITREMAATLTEEEAKTLIFSPGFSTKDTADDISGRGIGMDIVKRSIELLNGTIDVQTEKGKGTKITVKLPLTLAIINALIVQVGDEKYSVPMGAIVETQKIRRENILMIDGNEMVRLRDILIPLIRLDKIFQLDISKNRQQDTYPVIVVEYNDTLVGLLVDQFLTRHEMVIKSLAEHYRPIEGISGASIMGDGDIILILDVHGIIQLYKQLSSGHILSENAPRIIVSRKRNKEQETEKAAAQSAKETPSTVQVSAKPTQETKAVREPSKEIEKPMKEPMEAPPKSENDKQTLVDEIIRQAKTGAPIVNIDDLDIQEDAALSFHKDEDKEQSLQKLKEIFAPENRDMLKEWLRQGNYRAIHGIQALTGTHNIKLEKSKGQQITVEKIDNILDRIRKEPGKMIDFSLPINPLDGAVHFLLNEENAHKIVKLLLEQAGLDVPEELEYEPLMEVTNILGSAYTNSLTQITEVPVEPGVPKIIDDKDEIIQHIKSQISGPPMEILYIENKFLWEQEDIKAELLILVPEIKI